MNPLVKERLYKALHEKNALPRYVARRFLFNIFQRLGLHVTGDHFYEIVPNTRTVARTYQNEPRRLTGIDWQFAQSEQRMVRLLSAFGNEYVELHQQHQFREDNYYFHGFDALALYLMLRDVKPAKLIEIGRGESTRIALWALERNARATGIPCEFISIDPYERGGDLPQADGVRTVLVKQELQSVDFSGLLKGCQFLFVDSSHVYKFGSDVALEFVGIYPQLLPGTIVHLHDIYSPYEYPLGWIVQAKRFWNEQYFLECFLMFNQAFQVLLPMNLLVQQSKTMAEVVHRLPLPQNFQFRGSSFYMVRK